MRKNCKKMFAMLLTLAALAICVVPAGAASGFTDVQRILPGVKVCPTLRGRGSQMEWAICDTHQTRRLPYSNGRQCFAGHSMASRKTVWQKPITMGGSPPAR